MRRATHYGAEEHERAYQLWVTAGGRNAAHTRRLLRAEAGPGEPVPTDRSVRNWIRRYHWTARADRRFGDTRGRTHAELMALTLAVLQGEMDDVRRLLAGAGEPATEQDASRPRPARRCRH